MSKYAFKEYINSLWKDSGLPQAEFAKKVGVGYSTIKDALRGVTSIPQPSFLKALSKYTGLSQLKILQNVFFFEFSTDIKNDSDLNSLTLYACHLYQNNWSFVNTKLYTKLKPHYDKELKGIIEEDKPFYVSLKKSNYPKRIMYLDTGKTGPVGFDFAMTILIDMDNFLEENSFYQSEYTSFDCTFVYSNTKKNITLIKEIEKSKLIKPQKCNSISFVVFDFKTDKIIDQYTY